MADQPVEVTRQCRVGLAFLELIAQPVARQPAGPATVGHDVGDGLTAVGERHVLTRLDRGDDFRRSVAPVADAYLHVLQRSTSVAGRRIGEMIEPGAQAPDFTLPNQNGDSVSL